MDTKVEKKQFLIYLIAAYGVTFLMGLLMWYGNARGLDVSAFPNAQMMYPAAGVMLAYLLTRKEDERIPKGFYCAFLFVTILLAGVSVISVFIGNKTISMGTGSLSLWILLPQYIIIVGSLLCWGFFIAAGKEKREAYGLRWCNGRSSVFCILLFLILYLLRLAFSCAVSGEIGAFSEIFKKPATWVNLLALSVNFFLVFAAFFGEEYGWRYYMQPFLQKKYGLRGGVLILGVVWGLWHLPVDFFYYTSPEMGLIAAVSQQITCIFLSIFFAWAYMKTNNIWVPVILHFMNNNLIPIISGNYSADVLQNQQMSWGQLPMALLMNVIFFGGFLFSRVFREKED